jgi:hypothetical protein
MLTVTASDIGFRASLNFAHNLYSPLGSAAPPSVVINAAQWSNEIMPERGAPYWTSNTAYPAFRLTAEWENVVPTNYPYGSEGTFDYVVTAVRLRFHLIESDQTGQPLTERELDFGTIEGFSATLKGASYDPPFINIVRDLTPLVEAINSSAVKFIGGAGDDVVRPDGVLSTADELYGFRGHDVLDAGEGNDRVEGGKGKDQLFGGGGDDLVMGGRGKDELEGGPGADIFRFGWTSGKDHILDFDFAEGDRLELTNGVKARSIREVDTDQDGHADATILHHAGGSVTLAGVTGFSSWNDILV